MRLLLSICCALLLMSCERDEFFVGQYVQGPEVRTFSPCKSDQVYWASYDWGGVELRDFYNESVNEPYAPVYVHFRGHILDEERQGFAADYDGLIRISEVLQMAIEIPEHCR